MCQQYWTNAMICTLLCDQYYIWKVQHINNVLKDDIFQNDALIVFWGNCQALGYLSTSDYAWLQRVANCVEARGTLGVTVRRAPPFHNANFAKLLLYREAWCIMGMLLSAQVAHSMNLHSGISLQIEPHRAGENAGTHKQGTVEKCVHFCSQKDAQCPQVDGFRHCSHKPGQLICLQTFKIFHLIVSLFNRRNCYV